MEEDEMPQTTCQPRSNAERQAAFRRRRMQAHTALEAAKGLAPLPPIATIPGWRRWRQVIEQVEQALREVHEQMQSYYDDRSEEWQSSDKAEEFTTKMESVELLAENAAETLGELA
jgi:hypothetical protein